MDTEFPGVNGLDGNLPTEPANSHFRAAFTAEANGRYITSGHNSSLLEMAAALLDRYGKTYPIPRRTLPKWLVWLAGPVADKSVTRKMVQLNVNRPWRADNSRSRNELGMPYRSLQESINDFFQQ